MRVIILGSKDSSKLNEILLWLKPIKEIILPYADRVSEEWAKKNNCKIRIVKRKESYGASSWFLQREEMLRFSTTLVCFFDGENKYHKDWMARAKELGKDVYSIPVRNLRVSPKK